MNLNRKNKFSFYFRTIFLTVTAFILITTSSFMAKADDANAMLDEVSDSLSGCDTNSPSSRVSATHDGYDLTIDNQISGVTDEVTIPMDRLLGAGMSTGGQYGGSLGFVCDKLNCISVERDGHTVKRSFYIFATCSFLDAQLIGGQLHNISKCLTLHTCQ